MCSFEVNLNKAINICSGNCAYNHDFLQIYTFTTENVGGYIKYFDLLDKSLLTVGSSGDQILNAYFCGARDITLYDINEFTKYYVYLKIAAILCLDYKKFQEFFFKRGMDEYYNKKMFSIEIFKIIKPTLKLLDYESFQFFDELFSLYSAGVIRDFLFDDDESRNKVIRGFNIYLKDESSYKKLKSILTDITFDFINGDIFADEINGKFDNIFLSNLCTITSIERLKSLLVRLDFNNLKDHGSILFGYLWDSYFNSCDYQEDWQEIYNLSLVHSELKGFITEHHNINGSKDFLWNENKKRDLILIYRKK